MLWVKWSHVVFMFAWFAGLFYLPRIFVNLAMVPVDSQAERERLLLMAGKLYRFVTPLGVIAIVMGIWLWFGFGFSGGWLHLKALLAVLLVVYHLYCGRLLKAFDAGRCAKSHVWFRWFNELPVLILFAAVWLALFKPF